MNCGNAKTLTAARVVRPEVSGGPSARAAPQALIRGTQHGAATPVGGTRAVDLFEAFAVLGFSATIGPEAVQCSVFGLGSCFFSVITGIVESQAGATGARVAIRLPADGLIRFLPAGRDSL